MSKDEFMQTLLDVVGYMNRMGTGSTKAKTKKCCIHAYWMGKTLRVDISPREEKP